MKNCCLWINGKKISDINGIKENFNISDVRGYFYGGRLADWLETHGGFDEAELVRKIPKGENPDNMLQDIFCGKKEAPAITYHARSIQPPFISGRSCEGKDKALSTGISSAFSSYTGTAGSFGSFGHQFRFEFQNGSFTRTSFSVTSFGISSFNLGSFGYGSYAGFLMGRGGSFNYDDFINTLRMREKSLLSYFTSEPLNRYGYGIHLV